jgi:arabinofuranan 3-O-arabinosyltransferase
MTEGYNTGWRATAYGRTLTPVRMDGWQQGWKLPPGGDTRVTLSFGPAGRSTACCSADWSPGWLVLVLALLPVRREVELRPDPLPPLPAGGGGPRRWPRRRAADRPGRAGLGRAALALPRRWWAAGAGGALALAGVLLAVDPGAGWVQAADQGLAAAALCVVTAALVDWTRRPPDARECPTAVPCRQTSASRSAGRSTSTQDRPPRGGRAERGEHRDRDRAPAEVGQPVTR